MKNLVIEEYNNGDSPRDAVFEGNFATALLENPSSHKVSITRLKLPTSGIQSFYTTGSEYYLTYLNNTPYYLPNLKYYSADDVLEAINRTFQAAHENYYTAVYENVYSFSMVNSQTATDHITQASSVTATRSAYIRVRIPAINATGNIRVYLTTPAGLKTLVYSGDPPTETITISEASQYDSGDFIRPRDSLLQACNQSPNGNWVIQVVAANPLTDNFNINLTVAIIDHNTDGNLAPFVDLSSDGKLRMNYQQICADKNTIISVNPKMRTLLGFNDRWRQEGDEFVWTYPSSSLDHTNLELLQTVTQGVSHKYMLTNLDKILVVSDLSVNNDIFLGTKVQESILSDFTIDPAADLEYLSYSVENRPWRVFQLNSSVPLGNIRVAVRASWTNGHSEVLQFQPGENVFVRLSFFKIGEQLAS